MSDSMSGSGFMPHGFCLLWDPFLIVLFVLGNGLIALAYFSIPIALSRLISRRTDLQFKSIYLLFAAFILACGLTHVIKIWTLWHATYLLEGILDMLTGVISMFVAYELWKVLPKALGMPAAGIRLFQELFDSMPQIGWTCRPDGSADFFNKAWYQFTRSSFEEMKGWGWESVFDPEALPHIKERWQNSMKSEQPFEMEFQLRRHDGQLCWFLTRANPVHDSRGKLLRWIGVSTYIDDKKKAEAQLAEKQQWLEALTEVIPQLVWGTDAKGSVTYANGRWSDYTGLSVEASKGTEAWKDVVHADDQSYCLKQWRHCLRTGESFEVEYRIKSAADQSYRWFLVRALPTRDQYGNILSWVGSCTDIHEKREFADSLERKVQERTQQLNTLSLEAAEKARLFRGVFDNTFQLTGTISPEGILMEPNQSALNFVGVQAGEVVGKPFWLTPWFSHSEELQARVKLAIEEAASGEFVRFECQHIGKNGATDIDFSLKPVFDENNSVVVLIAEGRDITERKQAEKKMQELARELARSNQDLQQFAYVASHDLQEPLRTVSSFCDLLEKKATGKLDDSSEKYLRHIVDGTERMQVMVNALLAYAKVESQGKPLSPVKLSDSLNQALSSLSKLIDDSGAHIDAGDLPEVLGDSTQLSIVFQNLISNAIKYRSSDVIRVRIYAEKFDKVCRISVSDNGIGMDMKFAEKIFVIFQRLHSRSKYPGAGIGLAICKRIIERHGGEISVQSSLNNGSTFIFTLECPN